MKVRASGVEMQAPSDAPIATNLAHRATSGPALLTKAHVLSEMVIVDHILAANCPSSCPNVPQRSTRCLRRFGPDRDSVNPKPPAHGVMAGSNQPGSSRG